MTFRLFGHKLPNVSKLSQNLAVNCSPITYGEKSYIEQAPDALVYIHDEVASLIFESAKLGSICHYFFFFFFIATKIND